MKRDIQLTSKIGGKVGAEELFIAAGIGMEGIVSAETVEQRRKILLEDLTAFEEASQNPFTVIDQDLSQFEPVFRGAIALTLLERGNDINEITAGEAIRLLHEGDPVIGEQLSGNRADLYEYFAIAESNQIINGYRGKKFESTFNLAKDTRAFLVRNSGEEGDLQVKRLFEVLSKGKLTFDPSKIEKSWDELQKLLKEPEHEVEIPFINELVLGEPKLNALSLVVYQKMGMYIGEQSPLIQPILIAAFVCEPSEAPQYIAENLGIARHGDSVDEAIATVVENIQENTLTAEQLNQAGVALGRRILLAGYTEETTDLLIKAMKENCEVNEKLAIAAPVDRGILFIAGKIYEKVYADRIYPREELIEQVVAVNKVKFANKKDAQKKTEELRARLDVYDTDELQGILFFAHTENGTLFTREVKEALGVILMNLLAKEIVLDRPQLQAFDEVVLAACGKTYNDISTRRYTEEVRVGASAKSYGIAELMKTFPAKASYSVEDDLLDAVANLDQLGRYEIIKIKLYLGTFVLRSQLEKAVEAADDKASVPYGTLIVTGAMGKTLLKESKERTGIAIHNLFIKSPTELTAREYVGSAANIVRAIDEQISKIVLAEFRAVRPSEERTTKGPATVNIAVSKSAKSVIDKNFNQGLSEEEAIIVYKAALKALHEIDAEMFFDPEMLDDEAVLRNIRDLKHILKARTEDVNGMILDRNKKFGERAGLLAYRICEDEAEMRRKALIYYRFFDAENYIKQLSYAEVVAQIRKEVPLDISDEQLNKEIQVAITNFAVYTRYEMDPDIVRTLTPSASMVSVASYEQILLIREAVLKKVMTVRECNPILQEVVEYGGIDAPLEAITKRVEASSADAAFAIEFGQSLAIANLLLPAIGEMHELKYADNEREAVEAIGMYLFPDFSKKQRKALALAFIAKWGEALVQTQENMVEELGREQAQILEVAQLSARVSELLVKVLGYDFNGIEETTIPFDTVSPTGEKLQVEMHIGKGSQTLPFLRQSPTIKSLPIPDKKRTLREVVQKPGNGIVFEAQRTHENAVAPLRNEFEQTHKQHVPELYKNSAVAAEAVLEIAKWADAVRITPRTENVDVTLVAHALSLITPEEVANTPNVRELIANSVGRALQPLIDILEANTKAIRQIPIARSSSNGGNIDFILALSQILQGDKEDGEIDLRKPFSPNDSVVSITLGRPISPHNILEQASTLLKRAEEILTKLVPAEEPVVQTVLEVATERTTHTVEVIAAAEEPISTSADPFAQATERLLQAQAKDGGKKKKKGASQKVEVDVKEGEIPEKKKTKVKKPRYYEVVPEGDSD